MGVHGNHHEHQTNQGPDHAKGGGTLGHGLHHRFSGFMPDGDGIQSTIQLSFHGRRFGFVRGKHHALGKKGIHLRPLARVFHIFHTTLARDGVEFDGLVNDLLDINRLPEDGLHQNFGQPLQIGEGERRHRGRGTSPQHNQERGWIDQRGRFAIGTEINRGANEQPSQGNTKNS